MRDAQGQADTPKDNEKGWKPGTEPTVSSGMRPQARQMEQHTHAHQRDRPGIMQSEAHLGPCTVKHTFQCSRYKVEKCSGEQQAAHAWGIRSGM